jgi:colanic acid/amylovoran biosynthesis protein
MKTTGRQTAGRFQVALMGASLHTANRGVSALGASIATLIWRSRPEATISLLVGNRDARRAEVSAGGVLRAVETINYRLSPRAPLREQLWWILIMSAVYRLVPYGAARTWITRTNTWIRTVVEADFIGDIRGGDSFSDIYGLKNFLLDCLLVLSVIWIRGGLHLLPQTVGPFRSRIAGWLARHILLRAQSIWCRDRMSLQEVSRLTGGRRTGTLCPDVAFALEAIRPDRAALDVPIMPAGKTLIGLNVSGLMYHGGYTRSNMFGLRLDYRAFVKEVVEDFLSDEANRVLLVPHTFAAEGRVESDPTACRAVKESLSASFRDRVHLVTTAYDQHQIKGVIGMCEFFIGSRMHACIAALSQGIPTVGVAYSRKFAGVFATVGAGDWVIDGRTEDVQWALNRVKELFDQRKEYRTRLGASVAAAQKDLRHSFEVLMGTGASPGSNRDNGSRHQPAVVTTAGPTLLSMGQTDS